MSLTYRDPITSIEDLQTIAAEINFKNSIFEGLCLEYEFDFLNWQRIEGGFTAKLKFVRPDILTGAIGLSGGRCEIIPFGASYSFAVKTLWLLFKLLIEHEMMEAFQVGKFRPFNPHTAIENLLGVQADNHAYWEELKT